MIPADLASMKSPQASAAMPDVPHHSLIVVKLSDRLIRMIDGMPDDASITITTETIRGWLDEAKDEPIQQPTQHPPDFHWTWREKLWIAPAETRIGTTELAEAFGRPKSWVYAHTEAGAENPVPHRKLDGVLVFTVGEVRAWVRESEEVLVAGPMESTQPEIRSLMAV